VSIDVTAAAEALRAGDLARAEQLARAAAEHSDSLDCQLVLAQSLAWQGRGRDAEEVLAAIEGERALSDTELMAVALPRAANQFWNLGEPERATAFLQSVRNRVTESVGRTTIDALSATFAMNAGRPRRALEIAADVLASPAADGQAVAWAASTASLCAARTGRLDEVEPFAERALAAEYPGLLRFTIGLGQLTVAMLAGRLDDAELAARRFTDTADAHQPGHAIGQVLLAQVLMAKGDDGAALHLLIRAAPTLDRTGYSWGPLALTLLATALARRGDLAEAAKTLSRAESRHGTKSALFTPELGLARAWRLAAARDPHGAITAARQAAAMAERSGQSAVAVRVWHDAVRLGDLRAAGPLDLLAAEVGGLTAGLAAEHARALAAGDRDALTEVATRLAAAGMSGAAADAAAQAANV
jgi:tetratricopeptide (TPR) repeat protein